MLIPFARQGTESGARSGTAASADTGFDELPNADRQTPDPETLVLQAERTAL